MRMVMISVSWIVWQMLLALMDEAYTGSAIEDRGGDSGSDDNNDIDVSDPVFLDILKDENDGITVSFHLTCNRKFNMGSL